MRASLSGLIAAVLFAGPGPVAAKILWADPGARVTHLTGEGEDILGGAVKRGDNSNDALYFKFHVDPLSDVASEPYFAAFQLFEGNSNHLAVGNAPDAWGYSAFYTSETGPSNRAAGEYDLKSSHPEAAGMGLFKPYELPSHNKERTIVFKVQYVPGGDDLVTVWLNPKLSGGATEENQPETLTTKFKAAATFDQIRLRHEGGGNGWIFSDMAIATSFSDFVVVRFWQRWWFFGLTALLLLAVVGGTVRVVEKRKYQAWLLLAERERALERERSRIARDLHDDLGSSLARISLLSSLAREDLAHPRELGTHLAKIAQSADDTVRALEEIVWAVRPGSDSLQSLVEYIAHFSNELFEGNSTRCRLDLPHDLPTRTLPPDFRHNSFLVVKEALTNVLKHASATEVRVQAKASEDALELLVEDDGAGFEPSGERASDSTHGLANMRRRSESIGGTLSIESTRGQGTIVRLRVPFPPAREGATQAAE